MFNFSKTSSILLTVLIIASSANATNHGGALVPVPKPKPDPKQNFSASSISNDGVNETKAGGMPRPVSTPDPKDNFSEVFKAKGFVKLEKYDEQLNLIDYSEALVLQQGTATNRIRTTPNALPFNIKSALEQSGRTQTWAPVQLK